MRISPALVLAPFVFVLAFSCNPYTILAQQTPAPPQSRPEQTPSEVSEHEKAKEELHEEEHQRILGVVPNFNTINDPNAPPLTARQKFQLAFHSGLDPFQLV